MTAMTGDHDQIDVFLIGNADNLMPGRVAAKDYLLLCIISPQVIGKLRQQGTRLFFLVLFRISPLRLDPGIGSLFWKILHHMQQSKVCITRSRHLRGTFSC